jgi:hypothetical protein
MSVRHRHNVKALILPHPQQGIQLGPQAINIVGANP